jgi:hypothetical protein
MFHPTPTIPLAQIPSPRPGIWSRIQGHVARINAAHAHQARLSRLTGAEILDLALPVEDIMGVTPYAPDLPFFFQPGFQRR